MRENDKKSLKILRGELNLTNQSNNQECRLKCKIYYDAQKQSVQLNRTFKQIEDKKPKIKLLLQDSLLFYSNKQELTNQFIGSYPISQDTFISYSQIENFCIKLIYRKRLTPPSQPPLATITKAKKSGQRTIQQVKKFIFEWQQALMEQKWNNKKQNYSSIAKSIGINKKSIYDYIRWIKLGQHLNFDFYFFQKQKIGFLRKFVKEEIVRKREQDKCMKFDDPDTYWDSIMSMKEDDLFDLLSF